MFYILFLSTMFTHDTKKRRNSAFQLHIHIMNADVCIILRTMAERKGKRSEMKTILIIIQQLLVTVWDLKKLNVGQKEKKRKNSVCNE